MIPKKIINLLLQGILKYSKQSIYGVPIINSQLTGHKIKLELQDEKIQLNIHKSISAPCQRCLPPLDVQQLFLDTWHKTSLAANAK